MILEHSLRQRAGRTYTCKKADFAGVRASAANRSHSEIKHTYQNHGEVIDPCRGSNASLWSLSTLIHDSGIFDSPTSRGQEIM